MGNTLINVGVANGSDFMIHYLGEVNIGGTTVHITTTHVSLLIVSLFLIIVAVIVRVKINRAKPEDTPKGIQNVAEIVVEMLGNMVKGIMGTNAYRFVNYITAIFVFILVSNVSGLFGLRPPTADYGVTLPLGIITFLMVHYNGIKKNKGEHFKALFKPFALLFPINLIGEFAVPLSLSLRLFGNVMSGTVLMGLIYSLLPTLLTMGLPSVLHIYFDIFAGCIQAYVFSMLTMVYVNDKIAD
ncbi:MAG: F0F1 ATP synthase subunit A [Lachnospiraceae bacterium]